MIGYNFRVDIIKFVAILKVEKILAILERYSSNLKKQKFEQNKIRKKKLVNIK